MKDWEHWTKRELLKLPVRNWEIKSEYSSVLLVNTRTKHDSGYNLFAVIGCIGGVPKEIAGYMDDFRLDALDWQRDFFIKVKPYSVAIDCSMHGVFRLHTEHYKIIVGCVCSTTCFSFKEAE